MVILDTVEIYNAKKKFWKFNFVFTANCHVLSHSGNVPPLSLADCPAWVVIDNG